MATFVLVHGMGAGGWCWRDVSARLRENGHLVFTPTLTGLGERSHLASADVNLDTHIADVENLIRWEQLSDVILVGHSYGGAVVTGTADRVARQLRRLVYLDAFILRDGESIISLQPPDRAAHYETLARQSDDGWSIPANSAEFYGVKDREQVDRIDSLSVSHPMATLRQPIRLKTIEKPDYPRSYLWASHFSPSPFRQFAERVRVDADWDFREIEGSHMMMVSHVDATARVLHQLVESTTQGGTDSA